MKILSVLKIVTPVAVAGVMMFGGKPAMATNAATQQVTYQVSAINEISVTGTPSMIISAATAGSAPNSVSDNTTTYSITTNEASKKITASIGSAMPTGVTLTLNAAAPTGATSGGALTLSATAVDLVTGISTLNEAGKALSYTLSATSAAGVVASGTKTVTLTIV